MKFGDRCHRVHLLLFLALLAGAAPAMSARIPEPLLSGSGNEFQSETTGVSPTVLRRNESPELSSGVLSSRQATPIPSLRAPLRPALRWAQRGHRLPNGLTAPLLT